METCISGTNFLLHMSLHLQWFDSSHIRKDLHCLPLWTLWRRLVHQHHIHNLLINLEKWNYISSHLRSSQSRWTVQRAQRKQPCVPEWVKWQTLFLVERGGFPWRPASTAEREALWRLQRSRDSFPISDRQFDPTIRKSGLRPAMHHSELQVYCREWWIWNGTSVESASKTHWDWVSSLHFPLYLIMQADSATYEEKLDALTNAFDYPKEGLRDVSVLLLSSWTDTHKLQFGLLYCVSNV